MGHLFKQGFFVRQPAWHGLGVVVDEYPGMEEAMKLAGHDHEVVTVPLGLMKNDLVVPLSGYKALQRSTDGVVISVMKDTYEVIQNKVPWELIDGLFTSGAKFETAGVLTGKYDEANKEVKGLVYWTLALLNEPSKVKGDDSLIYPFLMASWSHDGSQSLRFRAMSTRVVCANTHHAAMYGEGADLDVSIKHYGRVEERMEKVKQAIAMSRKSHSTFMELANELASIEVSDEVIEKFIETVVPEPPGGITDRQRKNIMDHRRKMRGLFDGHTIAPAIRNTVYGMVEVGVEFLDHHRRAMNQNVYFSRNMLHTTKAKAQLIETAKELALSV